MVILYEKLSPPSRGLDTEEWTPITNEAPMFPTGFSKSWKLDQARPRHSDLQINPCPASINPYRPAPAQGKPLERVLDTLQPQGVLLKATDLMQSLWGGKPESDPQDGFLG